MKTNRTGGYFEMRMSRYFVMRMGGYFHMRNSDCFNADMQQRGASLARGYFEVRNSGCIDADMQAVNDQLQGRSAALSPNVFCNEGFDLISDPPLHKPIHGGGYRNPLYHRNQCNAQGQTPARVRRERAGVRHRHSRNLGFRSKPLAG